MKKAVFVIASKDFRDEEYATPRKILEAANVEIITASDRLGTAEGSGGLETKIDSLVAEIKPENFDAVVFVGGPGALEHLDNEISYRLLRETNKQNKILAAICIAPVILAKAGVLIGKEAAVWSGATPLCQNPVKILEENGASFVERKTARAQNIITANGPQAAEEFGKQILKALE